jgi:hypothetical protein
LNNTGVINVNGGTLELALTSLTNTGSLAVTSGTKAL